MTQSQSEGTIGYIEASYAIQAGYPVAKVLNDAGYYAEPTASNVAVALTKAVINTDPTSPLYLTQILDGVYDNPDPRAYPLSSYSYMIIPTGLQSPMTSDKGYTLGKFAYYFLCQGQQAMAQLGYSPLPINLVQAALTEVQKIPGVSVQDLDISKCNNPTFSSNGTNTLATTAPQPLACDKINVQMCPNGTGGLSAVTYVAPAAAGPATTTAPVVTTTSAPVKRTTNGASKSPSKPGARKTTPPAKLPAGSTPTGTAVPVDPSKPTTPTGGTTPGAVGVQPTAAGAPNATSTAHPTAVVPPPGSGSGGGGDNPDQTGGGAAPTQQAAQTGAGTGSTGTGSADGANGGAPVAPAGVANVQAIRAVPVSLAENTGWTLQDTLVVLAILMAVFVTVGPPLLVRRLRRGASS